MRSGRAVAEATCEGEIMALQLVSTREDVRREVQSGARAMVAGTMCYVSGANGYDWRFGQMPAD